MDLITFGCLLQLSIADLELRAWDSVSNLALALSPVSSVTYSLVIGQLMVATQVRNAAHVAYTPRRSWSGEPWAIRLGQESRLARCCGDVPSCWKRFHVRGKRPLLAARGFEETPAHLLWLTEKLTTI